MATYYVAFLMIRPFFERVFNDKEYEMKNRKTNTSNCCIVSFGGGGGGESSTGSTSVPGLDVSRRPGPSYGVSEVGGFDPSNTHTTVGPWPH